MAAATAIARSVSRSVSLRNAAARIASEARASRPPLRLRKQRTAASRFLRSPAETSFCAESLLPLHSAVASALMTSMLSVSQRGCGCLSEASKDDV